MRKEEELRPARGTDLVITRDARGNDYVLPLDFPDVAEELSAHVRRLLDAGDDLIVVRADRTLALREELAETQARLVMAQAQVSALAEERDRLHEEVGRKEAQLTEVQRALDGVNATFQRIGVGSPTKELLT